MVKGSNKCCVICGMYYLIPDAEAKRLDREQKDFVCPGCTPHIRITTTIMRKDPRV